MAKRVNWDFIKPLYRTGNLSNREICRQYAESHDGQTEWKTTVNEKSIRQKAKANPKVWAKSLAGKVKEQIKENLVRSQARDADYETPGMSDDEIVHQVAEVGTGVIKRHREDITALATAETKLLDELNELEGATADTTLKDKTIILKNIAHVRAQRIALERQAHNLNDDADINKGKSLEEFLLNI